MSAARRESRGILADLLFVGVTRPALALGVPYSALLVNAFATLELFLLTRNLLCLLVCLPLHALAWLLCLVEPRYFDLLAVWGMVRARAGLTADRAWRVRSYGSFASVGRRPQDVRTLVVESEGDPSWPAR
jgi:type IV secretion system protein VirB3